MKNLALAFLLMIATSMATTGNASAAMTEWKNIGGGKARLMAVLDPETSVMSAGVEVQLKDGWSTYWRYPGSAGIPPQFDFSSSRGFIFEKAHFPSPKLLGEGAEAYAGYKKHVTFPIEGQFNPQDSSVLRLKLFIGVCATVCVPAQAEFEISNDQLLHTDPLAEQILGLANSLIPVAVDSQEMILDKQLENTGHVRVTIKDTATNGPSELFVEGPSDWYLIPAKPVTRDNGKAVYLIDVSRAPEGGAVMKTPLVYTFVSGSKGYVFSD